MPRSLKIMRFVAAAGVTVAVAALVISASVGAGFEREYKRALLGFNAHVVVMGAGEIDDQSWALEELAAFSGASESELAQARRLGPWLSISEWLDGAGLGAAVQPGWLRSRAGRARELKRRSVLSMNPFLYREALLAGPGGIRGVIIKGVESSDEGCVLGMEIKLRGAGTLAQELVADGGGVPVLMGSAMAQAMEAGEGRSLKLVVPDPSGDGQRFVDIDPVGTFESGMHDYDSEFLIMDIAVARALFGAAPGVASGIELRLADPADAEVLAGAVEEGAGPYLAATTWGELNHDLLAAVRLERMVSAVIMGIMLLVAALNIVAVLVLTTIRRMEEISVLKALGLTDRKVGRLLVRGGMRVGAVGVALGLAVGLLASYLTGELGLVPLEGEVYMIDSLPIDISWSICGIVVLFCVLVVWLASKFASGRLAGVDPAEGLAQAR